MILDVFSVDVMVGHIEHDDSDKEQSCCSANLDHCVDDQEV